MEKKKVLFICRDNSARSLIAAAFLNSYFGDRYEAYSAGIKPQELNPHAVKALKEIGIDISNYRPQNIEELGEKKFDCLITLCDYSKKTCSSFPEHKKNLHKSFKDYCIPICCSAAGKNALCFPADAKPGQRGFKLFFDSGAKENDIIGVFRNLREAIFEWVEKEAVF